MPNRIIPVPVYAIVSAGGLLVCLLPVTVAASESSGITARFIPQQVLPGDVCQLTVEMDRNTYGRFELEVPAHPRLHRLAVERVPVSFVDGRYRQRQSLLLQPLSSGVLTISEARVQLSDQNGTQTIVLPDLALQVLPYETADTSNDPEPLPESTEETAASSSAIWFGVVAVVAILFIAAASLRRLRATTSEAGPESDLVVDVLVQLHSGKVPRDGLEQLLEQRSSAMSPELRCAIEQTVYAGRCQPATLATLLRQELPP